MALRTLVIAAALAGLCAPALAAQADDTARDVAGNWKLANGSCDNAYFKATERTQTVRGEQAMVGTATLNGMTVSGHMILQGARIGQLVNTMTDRVIFIFEPVEGKLHLTPLGPPVLEMPWADAVLEKCP